MPHWVSLAAKPFSFSRTKSPTFLWKHKTVSDISRNEISTIIRIVVYFRQAGYSTQSGERLNSMPLHRFTLGDFELTILSDGTYFLDAGSMFGVVPKSLWSKKVQPDERNLMPCGLNSVLVRGGEKTVLIEAGIGNKLSDKLKAIYEPQESLLKNFAEAGISTEDVDIVINSHLHVE